MLQQEHVIQIDLPPGKDQKDVEVAVGSRRTSYCSQRSSTSDAPQLCCVSPNYDSGNFSCSNVSDLSCRPNSYSSEDDCQDYSRNGIPVGPFSLQSDQKDFTQTGNALTNSAIDLRSVKSELERLTKSEKWYKNELKSQKRSKLELLEKLYLNERKFVRENQKLQMDCKRMYSLCDEIERRTLQEKDDLVRQLRQLQRLFESAKFPDQHESVPTNARVDQMLFEVQKQKSTIQEHENLIKLLRSQKQNLLQELKAMTTDRDLKLLEIEKKVMALEYENRTITKRYVALVQEKQSLEDRNRHFEEDLKKSLTANNDSKSQSNATQKKLEEQLKENTHLRWVISSLQQQSLEKVTKLEKEISTKFTEMEALKSCQIIQNARITSLQANSLKNQELQDLVQKHRSELSQKIAQIDQLRVEFSQKQDENSQLQAEIQQYQKLRENFDKYVSLLQGNSKELDTKCSEIEQLKSVIDLQTTQISELSLDMGRYELLKKQFNEALVQITNSASEAEQRSNEILLLKQQLIERDNKISEFTERDVQWQRLNENLSGELLSKELEFKCKEDLVVSLKSKCAAQEVEITRIRENQCEMDKLHEKLIDELHSERSMLSLKCLEMDELKQTITEFSTENQQLKHLLDVKNEHIQELEKQEMLIPGLRNEMNILKATNQEQRHQIEDKSSQLLTKDQIIASLTSKIEKCEMSGLEQINQLMQDNSMLKKRVKELEYCLERNNSVDQLSLSSLNAYEALRIENSKLRAMLQNQAPKLFKIHTEIPEISDNTNPLFNIKDTDSSKVDVEMNALKSIIMEQTTKINELTRENVNLKKLTPDDNNLQRSVLEAKLESCEKIHQFRQSPLTDCFKCDLIRKEKDDLLVKLNQLRETSLKVPETCDSQCQVNSNTDDVQQLKVLQKVMESEHRKQISRYEVHISTLLNKIKMFKGKIMEKTRSDGDVNYIDAKKLMESEKNVAILKQQLDVALKRATEVNAYKTTNSQLKFSLKSLMDNYKTVHQVLHKSEKSNISYDTAYGLIEKSNKFLPNFDSLACSINGLKEDITRLKNYPTIEITSDRRISLLDELKAAEAFTLN